MDCPNHVGEAAFRPVDSHFPCPALPFKVVEGEDGCQQRSYLLGPEDRLAEGHLHAAVDVDLRLDNVAAQANVENESDDPLLLRLRGAEDEADASLQPQPLVHPLVDGEVLVHAVSLVGGPDGRLAGVTNRVKVMFLVKGR
jgi:hypothetical protein